MLLLLSTLAHAADTDLDGVDDTRDRCAWEDDRIDLDRNRVPDCAESVLGEFGFADAASTASAWHDAFGVGMGWSPTDANSYGASGIAVFGPDISAELYYGACVPVTPGVRYTFLGQAGTDTADSTHRLIAYEFSDGACGRYHRATTVTSGYRAAGVSSLTLRGTYRPSSLSVRSVLLAVTAETHGVSGIAWFDDVSFHP